MKSFYLLACFVLALPMFAQTVVRGKLSDAESHRPIESASIAVERSAIGTISNPDGEFQLNATPDALIAIYCLGYEPLKLSAKDFGTELKSIELQPSAEKLEEIMVTKTPLYEVLAEVVRTSTARFNKPIDLHTYYREFVRNNGQYTNFADGLVDYHVTGTTKKTDVDVVVSQNRSVNLAQNEDDEGFPLLKVEDAVTGALSFKSLLKLAEDDYDDFDFELKSRGTAEGELYVLSFRPKAELEELKSAGSVIYDPKTKLILSLDVSASEAHKGYAKTINLLIARFSLLDWHYKAGYRLVGNNYVLAYNFRSVKLKVWNKKKIDLLLESQSDLVVGDFHPPKAYDKKAVFKKKFLYDLPAHYDTPFWRTGNGMVLTAEQQRIVSDLETAAAKP